MRKKLYIETYGCQMNIADSEIVASILNESGYDVTRDINEASLILLNTCSIRENAEQKIWNRLKALKSVRKKNPSVMIGVIGCMAERLKEKLIQNDLPVDIVAGPDSYRSLPDLVIEAEIGQSRINVMLSESETYADISPLRLDSNGVTAFIAIMRGCNNMCTYCVVPFVRGSERSRDPRSIVKEATELFRKGYREVTLIGQNVNSYFWKDTGETIGFPELLAEVARIDPLLRVRFATSHPKDLSDKLLETIASYDNICKHIHLPVQSGSNRILKLMNRQYTREWYMNRIEAIRKIILECSVSTDIIAGFCTETEENHKDTLSLMEWAGFDFAYMFKYNERPGTKAAESLPDDVPDEIKTKRLNEIINLQNKISAKSKKADVGKIHRVLVEGYSKRSTNFLYGRTSQNKVVVFPAENCQIGEYVNVMVEKCTSATLTGRLI
ncbi:MAG TPA: tRNA (N6-isopentenyl adenosine(37)-C2)-methylthiotransferase MiaB [Bacteroidales bacterium]|nr:tRNA (N6-isopentenyl adenosine(37)-C2)-methylthiotransferase MiaB [Bacteroidales bacterium]HOK75276.1 tRNA (N6-isopentenyl adenosine(37)-C2)-methylthiotransferase MiaB [Bacteroidales bacterium]HOM39772.1 tRNA (N6-isopentenyl adenosine(37)-C2)-methylthiotransferase MiaB [Bacteroidales bacterium]HPP91328.1 tRNA (N6-isopentenyl adenosine(37)-C2)-methylthiotransferase MiaB [Bacteroidales bacterium]HRR15336.1 tRNA (N6-isopentenyl adenosine(37)-C2)-methylthiotransferase MiaB [Bacteroidales bacteri